jgi:hypothetical protein
MNARASAQNRLAEVTLDAILAALSPYWTLVLDAGISAKGISRAIEHELVRAAATQVVGQGRRRNRSRISLATGVPRNQVALILGSRAFDQSKPSDRSAWRELIDVWSKDLEDRPKGNVSADIPVFGRKSSFESLVLRKGRGIPVRAFLDELLDISAVKWTAEQRIALVTTLSPNDRDRLANVVELVRRKSSSAPHTRLNLQNKGQSTKGQRKNLKRERR